MKGTVIKIIIIGIVILILVIAATFFILSLNKTILPLSSKPLENKTLVVSEKQPSKTLKVYTDSSGFSFKYPDDVQISKKGVTDAATYADIALTSTQIKGNISIKIADTKVKSIDDWFLENKTILPTATKDVKIGELSGRETKNNDKLTTVALNQGVLFTIEVDLQGQQYWLNVYNTILSSFSFVPPESAISAESGSNTASDDVVLEEETVE